MALSLDQMQSLINIKLDFHRNEELQAAFIDRLLTNHPEMAVSVYESLVGKGKQAVEFGGRVYYVDCDQYQIAVNFAKGKDKIKAIKQIRAITGFGLKEAKDYVEQTWPDEFHRNV
jgi:hypothetical protein